MSKLSTVEDRINNKADQKLIYALRNAVARFKKEARINDYQIISLTDGNTGTTIKIKASSVLSALEKQTFERLKPGERSTAHEKFMVRIDKLEKRVAALEPDDDEA